MVKGSAIWPMAPAPRETTLKTGEAWELRTIRGQPCNGQSSFGHGIASQRRAKGYDNYRRRCGLRPIGGGGLERRIGKKIKTTHLACFVEILQKRQKHGLVDITVCQYGRIRTQKSSAFAARPALRDDDWAAQSRSTGTGVERRGMIDGRIWWWGGCCSGGVIS